DGGMQTTMKPGRPASNKLVNHYRRVVPKPVFWFTKRWVSTTLSDKAGPACAYCLIYVSLYAAYPQRRMSTSSTHGIADAVSVGPGWAGAFTNLPNASLLQGGECLAQCAPGIKHKMTIHKARFSQLARAVLLAGGLLVAGAALAFPDKPVKLLIPYPPGGSADAL